MIMKKIAQPKASNMYLCMLKASNSKLNVFEFSLFYVCMPLSRYRDTALFTNNFWFPDDEALYIM